MRPLDRILHARVFALDPRLHERGVSEDETPRCADEPEKGPEGGGDVEEGEADDEEGGVEGFLGDGVGAELEGFGACVGVSTGWARRWGRVQGKRTRDARTKPVYRGEPAKEKDERDEEERVGDPVVRRARVRGCGTEEGGGTYTA